MKKFNSKKSLKVITISTAVALFGIGAAFAVTLTGSANSENVQINNTQVAGGQTVDTQKETVSVTASTLTNDSALSSSANEIASSSESNSLQNINENEKSQNENSSVETELASEGQAFEQNNINEETQNDVETEAQTEVQVIIEESTQAQLSEDDINSAQASINAQVYAGYISEVYSLINQERAAAGVSAVSYDSSLTIMACHRAVENAKNDFMVVGSDGHHLRPNNQNASSICYYYNQYGSFGENLGRYQSTPSEIVVGWHESPAHYRCMTSTTYSRVGIGVAQDSSGYYYWTAIFMD